MRGGNGAIDWRPARWATTSINARAGSTVAPRASAASAATDSGNTKARPSRCARPAIPTELRRRHLSRGGQNADRDRLVEAAALLRDIGRREVDGDASLRALEVRRI